MTQVGNTYGQSLYELAKEEKLTDVILQELNSLKDSFSSEPDFIKLLSSPNISKQERCQIIDNCFRDMVNLYVLNFLKILTEKNLIKHFPDCCDMFGKLYQQDHNILSVTAVTAVPLSSMQYDALCGKLTSLTGKQIHLHNRVESSCLGGVRLDFDGQRVDGTVKNRLDQIRDLLNNTVL